ncbi:MAG: response regulator SirA [Elusimicrobiota bacterium]|nr:response regulator SirA [Elusimicrobiota bacterium]
MKYFTKIEKIISKTGDIVPYEPEKIINSITKTIVDVEEIKEFIARMRAKKYFELIDEAIYNEFYNIEYLLEDFFRKYINFEPSERHRRLENARVTERLCIQTYLFMKHKQQSITVENVKNFLLTEIEELEQKYRKGLFPAVTEEEKKDIIQFLTERIMKISAQELTKEKLYPSREFVMDMIENVLKRIGEIEIAEGFMIFREGKKKLRDNELLPEQFTRNGIHEPICERTLSWNIEHECENIFDLNDWVACRKGKDIRELIKLSDERFMNDVLDAVKKILEHKDRIRIVIIAGPSSSNKTTTTIIIGNELAKYGLKLKQLNVDDYFKDLKDQPKDEFGDYDFEMPEAIDMELLNKHLDALLKGKTIEKPCYNFKLGQREKTVPFHLEQDEILLIDCLHGLYRKLTEAVPKENKFKIYIESMNILRDVQNHYTRWTDIRMLKRMIRDVKYRNHKTEQTLAHWPYVRKGELKHIIPYIFSTDVVINSGLPYELPALKKALEGLYPSDEFIENLRKEGRIDPYIRGMRVKLLLETVEAINDLSIIPATSPLREFIGGSAYVIPHNE